MKIIYIGSILSFISLIFISCSESEAIKFTLEIQPSKYISKEVPVHVKVKLPATLQDVSGEKLSVTLESSGGEYKDVPGQIIGRKDGQYELWWILPETGSDNPVEWTATVTKSNTVNSSTFTWEDTPDKHLDLFFDGKRVFSYDYELDNHFEKGETLTARNKPFYHIYDLLGESKITNGPEEGVWSHHRGIMIGWRDLGFNGEELSFWGMEDLTVQRHIEFTENTSGPVLAQTEALIQWNDSTGNTIVEERRQATIFRQSAPGILLMDFSSSLQAVGGPITLDGNADHGGVQFRANNDVAEGSHGSKKATYYFHQDSINPVEDYNLPWVAMSYGLNNKTYSILQMDNPENPDPTLWSADRDYGRFGPFFRKELNADEKLTIQYRFWMSENDMPDKEELSSKYTMYVDPIQVKTLSK